MLEKAIARTTPEALRASELQKTKLDEAARNLILKNKDLDTEFREIDQKFHENRVCEPEISKHMSEKVVPRNSL